MRLAIWLSLILFLNFVKGLVELKNIKCKSIDKSFADFDYCYIRAINRTYKYFSLKVKLFKVPISNVTINVDVRKRANGYKPFLYNVTFDACKFMRSKKNPLIRFIYSFIENYSNLNHTCPYDHDLIVEKLDANFINNRLLDFLPVPDGEYGIFTVWSAYNIPRAHVDMFGTLS